MAVNGDALSGCRIREIPERVGGKWPLKVIFHLGDRTLGGRPPCRGRVGGGQPAGAGWCAGDGAARAACDARADAGAGLFRGWLEPGERTGFVGWVAGVA
jgi:hypothetical protein